MWLWVTYFIFSKNSLIWLFAIYLNVSFCIHYNPCCYKSGNVKNVDCLFLRLFWGKCLDDLLLSMKWHRELCILEGSFRNSTYSSLQTPRVTWGRSLWINDPFMIKKMRHTSNWCAFETSLACSVSCSTSA